MKKIIQVSIVLILAFALVIGLLQIGIGGELPLAGRSCRVGWNTRGGDCLALIIDVREPIFLPSVGWNS